MRKTLCAAALFALLTTGARADIIWTIADTDYTAGSGGTLVLGDVSGTFETDNAGDILSWNLTTANGTYFPGGETYSSATGTATETPGIIDFYSASGLFELAIWSDQGSFASAEIGSESGEVVEFDLSTPLKDRSTPSTPFEASDPPIPTVEPAGIAILAVGLLGLAYARRRGPQTA